MSKVFLWDAKRQRMGNRQVGGPSLLFSEIAYGRTIEALKVSLVGRGYIANDLKVILRNPPEDRYKTEALAYYKQAKIVPSDQQSICAVDHKDVAQKNAIEQYIKVRK